MLLRIFRTLTLAIVLCPSTLSLPGKAAAAEFRQCQGILGSSESCGTYITRPDDSLVELARQFGLGFNEIVAANPGVDPFIPPTGTKITLPTEWIVPDVPLRRGIVINISEMRLYLFDPRNSELVLTFPVGIGDEGLETPTGTFSVTAKLVNPPWHVPDSIRRESPGMPKIVPPGPDNPLGTHALRLSAGSVLIHGTNRPFAIGRRVSHGCIRLYPEDIEKLFRDTSVGDRVTIVRQPVKAALVAGRVMVELHGSPQEELLMKAAAELTRKGLLEQVNLVKLMVAALHKTGIPTDVSW
jgi:L,D-transpeptidase ErfK/SrfK